MLNKTKVENINLDLTLLSGQTFSWNKTQDKFIGSFVDKIVILKQEKDNLFWQTYPKTDDFEFIKNYLNLDHDYKSTFEKIKVDEHTTNAVNKYTGLTVLNQNIDENLFSFILASNKNIKAIRRSLEILKAQNNKFIEIEGEKHFLFPRYEFFKEATISDLIKSGVGYRAKYLKDAAEKFENLKSRIQSLNYQPNLNRKEGLIREELINIFGVGDKIADCVMTFSLGFKDLTPVDIWSERIIKDLYANTTIKNYSGRREWFREKFGENTAIAGQYLFEYIRNYDPKNYIK